MDTRIVLSLAPSTAARLRVLHETKGVTKGEILRQALSLFSYLSAVLHDDPQARILIERSQGRTTELVMPTDLHEGPA